MSQATFDEISSRCENADVPLRIIDHGYCTSMYMKSADDSNAEAIAEMRRKDAHTELARWLAGDRRTDNGDRPH